MNRRVFKICLTGGPKAGKSTVLEYLKNYFDLLGYDVITVPETATLLRLGGIPIQKQDGKIFDYQSIIYKLQSVKEYAADFSTRFLTSPDVENKEKLKDIVILYDRGVLDNRAYLTDEQFELIASEYKDNILNLSNNYDGVIALNSCSNIDGMYSTENGARVEDCNTAKLLDERTIDGYKLANNLFIIGARENMEDKINAVKSCVNSILNNKILQKNIKGNISKEDAINNILKNNATEVKYECYCKESSAIKYLLEKRTFQDKSIYNIRCLENTASEEIQTCDKMISQTLFEKYLSENSFDYKINEKHYVYYKDNYIWTIKTKNDSIYLLELHLSYQENIINVKNDYPSFSEISHIFIENNNIKKMVRKK